MWGRTREILRLYNEGMSNAEIARLLDCSNANVSLTIKRHAVWDHSVSGIPIAHQQWLIDRAKKLRQRPSDMAARLLKEIIEQYITGDR